VTVQAPVEGELLSRKGRRPRPAVAIAEQASAVETDDADRLTNGKTHHAKAETAVAVAEPATDSVVTEPEADVAGTAESAEYEARDHAEEPETEIPVPAPVVESFNAPDESGAGKSFGRGRRTVRRKRRGGLAPKALIEPVDIPLDATGRVEFIYVNAPADQTVKKPRNKRDKSIASQPAAAAKWTSVVILGFILAIVLMIGIALTR
jgi:hypothetical protein